MRKIIKSVKKFVSENKKELLQIGFMAVTIVLPDIINMTHAQAAATLQSGNGQTIKMPWSTGINSLQSELTGPIPKIAATIAVAGTGMMMAFGEMSGLAKKGVQVVFGMGIAIGAVNLVSVVTGDATIVSGLIF